MQTISELAVALVGFSGIVVTFDRRKNWDKKEIRNFFVMMRASLGAMFLSFSPYVMAFFFDTDISWRICSGIVFLVIASNLYYSLWENRGVGSTGFQRAMGPIGILMAIANLLAVIGLIPRADIAVVCALIMQLGVGTHNFLILLVTNLDSNIDSEEIS